MKNFDSVQDQVGNIGRYQFLVFLSTQLGYVCVTGSMLSTVYDNLLPEDMNCTLYEEDLKNSTGYKIKSEFRSLLFDLGLVCRKGDRYFPTLFSTAVMLGGVAGAATNGYLADRYGRKICCITTLVGCMVMNGAICGLALYSWILTLCLFVMLGFCGGGYMVVNLVMLLESVGGTKWRLGATAFNGWPFGLIIMGLLGYITKYWRWYHLSLAIVAFPCVVAQFWIHESARWLVQHHKINRASSIMRKIAATNNKELSSKFCLDEVSVPASPETNSEPVRDRNYSYIDLFRYRSILLNVLALFYSWLASSIISFGIYFNMGNLWGNVFLKMFLLGLFKGSIIQK